MEYVERLQLATIVMRNFDKGETTPQSEREEEIQAFKRVFEEGLLTYGGIFYSKNPSTGYKCILSYHWGKWTPTGKKPCWGPYAIFKVNGEAWKMAIADPYSIKVLIMPPDADQKSSMNVFMVPAIPGEQTLEQFLKEESLPTYIRNKGKR